MTTAEENPTRLSTSGSTATSGLRTSPLMTSGTGTTSPTEENGVGLLGSKSSWRGGDYSENERDEGYGDGDDGDTKTCSAGGMEGTGRVSSGSVGGAFNDPLVADPSALAAEVCRVMTLLRQQPIDHQDLLLSVSGCREVMQSQRLDTFDSDRDDSQPTTPTNAVNGFGFSRKEGLLAVTVEEKSNETETNTVANMGSKIFTENSSNLSNRSDIPSIPSLYNPNDPIISTTDIPLIDTVGHHTNSARDVSVGVFVRDLMLRQVRCIPLCSYISHCFEKDFDFH